MQKGFCWMKHASYMVHETIIAESFHEYFFQIASRVHNSLNVLSVGNMQLIIHRVTAFRPIFRCMNN